MQGFKNSTTVKVLDDLEESTQPTFIEELKAQRLKALLQEADGVTEAEPDPEQKIATRVSPLSRRGRREEKDTYRADLDVWRCLAASSETSEASEGEEENNRFDFESVTDASSFRIPSNDDLFKAKPEPLLKTLYFESEDDMEEVIAVHEGPSKEDTIEEESIPAREKKPALGNVEPEGEVYQEEAVADQLQPEVPSNLSVPQEEAVCETPVLTEKEKKGVAGVEKQAISVQEQLVRRGSASENSADEGKLIQDKRSIIKNHTVRFADKYSSKNDKRNLSHRAYQPVNPLKSVLKPESTISSVDQKENIKAQEDNFNLKKAQEKLSHRNEKVRKGLNTLNQDIEYYARGLYREIKKEVDEHQSKYKRTVSKDGEERARTRLAILKKIREIYISLEASNIEQLNRRVDHFLTRDLTLSDKVKLEKYLSRLKLESNFLKGEDDEFIRLLIALFATYHPAVQKGRKRATQPLNRAERKELNRMECIIKRRQQLEEIKSHPTDLVVHETISDNIDPVSIEKSYAGLLSETDEKARANISDKRRKEIIKSNRQAFESIAAVEDAQGEMDDDDEVFKRMKEQLEALIKEGTAGIEAQYTLTGDPDEGDAAFIHELDEQIKETDNHRRAFDLIDQLQDKTDSIEPQFATDIIDVEDQSEEKASRDKIDSSVQASEAGIMFDKDSRAKVDMKPASTYVTQATQTDQPTAGEVQLEKEKVSEREVFVPRSASTDRSAKPNHSRHSSYDDYADNEGTQPKKKHRRRKSKALHSEISHTSSWESEKAVQDKKATHNPLEKFKALLLKAGFASADENRQDEKHGEHRHRSGHHTKNRAGRRRRAHHHSSRDSVISHQEGGHDSYRSIEVGYCSDAVDVGSATELSDAESEYGASVYTEKPSKYSAKNPHTMNEYDRRNSADSGYGTSPRARLTGCSEISDALLSEDEILEARQSTEDRRSKKITRPKYEDSGIESLAEISEEETIKPRRKRCTHPDHRSHHSESRRKRFHHEEKGTIIQKSNNPIGLFVRVTHQKESARSVAGTRVSASTRSHSIFSSSSIRSREPTIEVKGFAQVFYYKDGTRKTLHQLELKGKRVNMPPDEIPASIASCFPEPPPPLSFKEKFLERLNYEEDGLKYLVVIPVWSDGECEAPEEHYQILDNGQKKCVNKPVPEAIIEKLKLATKSEVVPYWTRMTYNQIAEARKRYSPQEKFDDGKSTISKFTRKSDEARSLFSSRI